MNPQTFTLTAAPGNLSVTLGALFARRCSHSILLLMRQLEPDKTTRLAAIKNRLTDRFQASSRAVSPPVNLYCPPGHTFTPTLSESIQPQTNGEEEPLLTTAWIYWDLEEHPVAQHELTRHVDDIIKGLPKNCHPAVIVQAKAKAPFACEELLNAMKLHLSGTTPLFVVKGSKSLLRATNFPDTSWGEDGAAKVLAATLCYPLLKDLTQEIYNQFPDNKERALDLKTLRQIFLDTLNDQ